MKNRSIYWILFLFFVFFSQIAFAATAFPGYQPLTSIPGISGNSSLLVGENGSGLYGYLDSLYKMGVAAAAGLAVIMVIWGGIQYITSAAGEGKGGGKERITSAILGLLLALGSYIILQTINPQLLRLGFTLPDAPAVQGSNPYTAAYDKAYQQSEQAFKDLKEAQVKFDATASKMTEMNGLAQLSANATNPTFNQQYNAAVAAWQQAKLDLQTAQRNFDNLTSNTNYLLYMKAHYGQ